MIFMSICLMMTLLNGCTKKDKVVVASKPHAEQYILGEMICQLIEEKTDLEVERKLGIGGGTANVHPAMLKGDIDIFPEYTGTSWLFVLKEEHIADKDDLYDQVAKRYEEDYQIKWLGRYGFNNTFCLAVRKDVAEDLGLASYSDLKDKGLEIIFGAEYDFYERKDGLQGLQEVYGMTFKENKELDIGLKYEAIGSGEVDIIDAFSTDGLLAFYDLKVLEDDKSFFPAYEAATIIRTEVLEKYPELEEVLAPLEGLITDEDMIRLNCEVEKELKDPEDVARAFLVEKGLL